MCDTNFKTIMSLQRHQEENHGIMKHVKTVPCPDCDMLFTSAANSKQHFIRAHQRLKNHKCTHCDKAFYMAGDLTAHIKCKHLKIRDFHCSYCDLSVSAKPNLKTHIQKMHPNLPLPSKYFGLQKHISEIEK